MRFRTKTIFWAFALLASAVATFGPTGILAAALVIGFWTYVPNRPLAFLIQLLFCAAILGLLVALLLPAVQSPRRVACRNSCMNNMKQIALALHWYENDHGSFPPAYITDEDGKPMHSWRVLILPHLECQNLYDLYRFDEPWDGPNNRLLWKHMPEIYRCPGCKRSEKHGLAKYPPHTTNYFAVVGPQTVLPGSKTMKFSDITDGTSQTIMFLESSESTCWMEPKDLSYEEAIEQLTNGNRNGHLSVKDGFLSVSVSCFGRNAAFADGHVNALGNHLPSDVATMLLTANGKESLAWETDFEVYRIKTIIKWRRVYSLSVFIGLSLLPLLKLSKRKKAA